MIDTEEPIKPKEQIFKDCTSCKHLFSSGCLPGCMRAVRTRIDNNQEYWSLEHNRWEPRDEPTICREE